MKATQREPAGSTLWSRLEVISTVPGLREIKYGHSSSQKAILAPSGTCCLSKAILADAPRCGCRSDVCQRGWVSTRASGTSVLPLTPQQLPLPALQLAPSLPPCGDSCCSPSSCSGVRGRKGEWKEAQPRRGEGNPLPAFTPGPLEKMV